jgi:hypothetical protein
MNWHSIFATAILVAKAVLVGGVVGMLVMVYVSDTQKRIVKYKKSGRLTDLLRIFSRY